MDKDFTEKKEQSKGWNSFIDLNMKDAKIETPGDKETSNRTEQPKGWSGFIEFNEEKDKNTAEIAEEKGEKDITEESDNWSDFSEVITKPRDDKLPAKSNVTIVRDDNEQFRPKLTGLDELKDNNEEDTDPLPTIAVNPNNSPSLEGFLIVWGCGEFGQHGHGHHSDVPISSCIMNPLLVGQDGQVTHVACGSSHTLVVTGDNRLFSWGNSNSGQLGIGVTETTLQPHLIPLGVMPGSRIQGVACGTRHSFVWTEEGECFSFGNNYSAQLGYDFRKPDFKENQTKPIYVDTLFNRKVLQVACGSRHSLFLFSSGHLAAVGCNSRGQIGVGDKIDTYCIKNIPDMQGITSVACGNGHCLAADVHGEVYAWGYSKACGSREDVLSPQCIFKSTGYLVEAIAGGDSHSMILLNGGQLFTCGNNYEGQLGQGSDVKFSSKPAEVCHTSLQGKVQSISVGENTSAAITDEGQLFMWGQNSSQVICEDKDIRHFQYKPYHVDLGDWKAHRVSCGSWHVTCIVSGSYIRPSSGHRPAPVPLKMKSETSHVTTDIDMTIQPDHVTKDITMTSNDSKNDVSDDDDVTDVFMDYPLEETMVDCYGNVVEERPHTRTRSVTESALESRPRSSSKDTNSPPGKAKTEERDFGPCEATDANDSNEKDKTLDAIETQKEVLLGDNDISDKPINKTVTDSPQEEKQIELKSDHSGSKSTEAIGMDNDTSIAAASEFAKPIVPLEEKLPLEEKPKTVQTKHERPKSRTGSAVKREVTIARSSKAVNPQQLNKPLGNVTIGFTQNNERVDRPVSKQPPTKKIIGASGNERSPSRSRVGSAKGKASPAAAVGQEYSSSPLMKRLNRSPQREQLPTSRQANASPTPTWGGNVATWSPPARPRTRVHPSGVVGQLNREKRPVRSLRKMPTVDDMAYCLPNQPMDVTGDSTWTRPRPAVRRPVTRTQSNPNMYITTPNTPPSPNAKMRAFSTSSPQGSSHVHRLEPSDLPPIPPRTQRPGRGHKPVFSSGSSWRRRSSDLL